MPSSRGYSPPRAEIPELGSPTLQVDFLLLSEPSGKTKNTGVGSLSLLQGIFLTQELNLGWERGGGPPALQAESLPSEPPGKPYGG